MNTSVDNQEHYKPISALAKKQGSTWAAPLFTFLVLGALIGWLWYRVEKLEQQLDYVAALAENADMYSHSHGYSDAKLKTDIRELETTTDDLLSLHAIRYSWRDSAQVDLSLGSATEVGLLAQDVEKVYPELVWVDKNNYKHVDYARLSAVLIEAIREQQYEIDLLENRISEFGKNP